MGKSMWYIVGKKEIKVKLTPELIASFNDEAPIGAELSDDSSKITIKYEGEEFDAESLEKYLKCAIRKGKFDVFVEDHHGENEFAVSYGPNHFECK
jgi:folate-dependent tRNA-U54 methylase TrmFO/GidA